MTDHLDVRLVSFTLTEDLRTESVEINRFCFVTELQAASSAELHPLLILLVGMSRPSWTPHLLTHRYDLPRSSGTEWGCAHGAAGGAADSTCAGALEPHAAACL